MKKETCITIRRKITKNQKSTAVEELRNAIRASNLQDETKEETLSNVDGYEIWFKMKKDAKAALKRAKKYLKDKNLWDKKNCESNFKESSIAWEIYYYDACASLEVKDVDSIPIE
jgi:hypothetical protein